MALLLAWSAAAFAVLCAAGRASAEARRAYHERPDDATPQDALSVALYDHGMEFAPPVLALMLAASIGGAGALELNGVGLLLAGSVALLAAQRWIGQRNASAAARALAWIALAAGAVSALAHQGWARPG